MQNTETAKAQNTELHPARYIENTVLKESAI